MAPFEQHLQKIGQMITISDEDRATYTKDFDRIRDWVLGKMCDLDPVFKKLYNGPSLFGSYWNNVRIRKPDEFDIIFELKMPLGELNVKKDNQRPGYVQLDFTDVLDRLSKSPHYADVYQRFQGDLVNKERRMLLQRNKLQRWLHGLFEKVFEQYGDRVSEFRLQYSKRGLAHTIYAVHIDGATRTISIDFVPGIVLEGASWLTFRDYSPFHEHCYKWYALPKPSTRLPKGTRRYAFMICNPVAEHELLLQKQNLKVVFRLLKALRDRFGMIRFKSYFITTAFLWRVQYKQDSFWHRPVADIFLHMLDVLAKYFESGVLPFYWAKDLNLLQILKEEEISKYAQILRSSHNTMKTYVNQPLLGFFKCARFFKINVK